MVKKIITTIAFACLVAFPHASDALSLYSYGLLPEGSVAVGEYEASDIEKVGEGASRAVIIIDGYKDMPVYLVSKDDKGEKIVKELGTAQRRVSSGSGFFVTSDGYILTNRHVIDEAGATYRVDTGSQEIDATVVYKDPSYDLAVIKIPGQGYPTIRLAKSADVKIGDEIVGVGNALGKFVDSISSGRVVSLNETVVAREGKNAEVLRDLIATDAKLYPGDSGGPLLDETGTAIGVNVAIEASGTRLSFSIPASITREVLLRAGLRV